MRLTVATPPSVEPVTVAEVRLHGRIDVTGSDVDAEIERLIKAGREMAEVYTRRAFLTTSMVMRLERFPVASDSNPWAEIELPRPPLIAVQSVSYVTPAGATVVLVAGTDYEVDTSGERGCVRPIYGGSWPSARLHPSSVTIAYTCGYGATAATVPACARQAVCLYVTDLYDHSRGTFIVGTIVAPLPLGAKHLLDSIRAFQPAGVLQADELPPT